MQGNFASFLEILDRFNLGLEVVQFEKPIIRLKSESRPLGAGILECRLYHTHTFAGTSDTLSDPAEKAKERMPDH